LRRAIEILAFNAYCSGNRTRLGSEELSNAAAQNIVTGLWFQKSIDIILHCAHDLTTTHCVRER
jgi:hypothetical protein